MAISLSSARAAAPDSIARWAQLGALQKRGGLAGDHRRGRGIEHGDVASGVFLPASTSRMAAAFSFSSPPLRSESLAGGSPRRPASPRTP
jgi:hypothetical protein